MKHMHQFIGLLEARPMEVDMYTTTLTKKGGKMIGLDFGKLKEKNTMVTKSNRYKYALRAVALTVQLTVGLLLGVLATSARPIRTHVGVVTVKDYPTSPQRPHSYVIGTDNNLWVNFWNGSWKWKNLVRPPGLTSFRSTVGVTTVKDHSMAPERPYAYVIGDDGNLWVNFLTGSEQWYNLDNPPGAVNILSPVGVHSVEDNATTSERPHAYVIGTDNNLWVNFWNGSQWLWLNLHNPSDTVNIRSTVGVLTARDYSTAPERPYVYVIGTDNNLWVNFWNGSEWQWYNLGRPPGSIPYEATIRSAVGVVTVKDNSTAPERPYAYVIGTDNNLWVNFWNDSSGWQWYCIGNPPGAATNSYGVGVLTVMNDPMAPQRPYAFVIGTDNNLWHNFWNGSTWKWTNQGNPPGAVTIGSTVGVITVMDYYTAPQRPYVYVIGSDNKLWHNLLDGSTWRWYNLNNPPD